MLEGSAPLDLVNLDCRDVPTHLPTPLPSIPHASGGSSASSSTIAAPERAFPAKRATGQPKATVPSEATPAGGPRSPSTGCPGASLGFEAKARGGGAPGGSAATPRCVEVKIGTEDSRAPPTRLHTIES
jgi:hypothetical protein